MRPGLTMYRRCAANYPGNEHSANLCWGSEHATVLSADNYPSGEQIANLR